ncbi:MAG: PQQ-dependent sugar dehydrogenase [Trueperaceae bacterium]|nr:PQQ-dependent sugar dehydrogenase [Trueperaceae bacterium]
MRTIPLLLLCAWPFGASAGAQQVGLQRVATGFERPVGIVTDGSDVDRTYVLEQTGAVRVIENGTVAPEPFLDLRDHVSVSTERGLLGLAFHPDSPDTPEVFVHYTDVNGDTMLQRMPVADGRAQLAKATPMLQLSQPSAIHNGGQLAFGPDGYLYMALGDGGAGGDPDGNGQNPATLHGSILRLDVREVPYGVPPDNPFVGHANARDEIWAYGLRNPWRFSFGPEGALWIADVGQASVEEVNREPPGSRGGRNYGWNVWEGDTCFGWPGCSPEGTVLPVIAYDRERGWGRAVTGGYVYAGDRIPELVGSYLFGDFVGGKVLVARPQGLLSSVDTQRWEAEVLLDAGFPISSFGREPNGELLIADYRGSVWRLVPRP